MSGSVHVTFDEKPAGEVAKLERVWLAAESKADQAKRIANRAERAAAELGRLGDREDRELKLLVGEAARLAASRDAAEAEAEAAFERFWTAKSSGA